MKQSLIDVCNLETVLKYCTDHLDWGIDEVLFEDIDEAVYDFSASDLGIKEEEFSNIVSLKQLRPLTDSQPWGIFFVDFESKKFEVTALRRILNSLVPRRRNTEHQTWIQEHLLFICFWGEINYRSIGFIAFENNGNGLPLVRALYCTPKIEDRTYIENFEHRIKGLKWPANDDVNWIAKWSAVFAPTKGNVINDTKHLTEVLASKALKIVELLKTSFVIENENGMANKIYSSFNSTLSVNISINDFIDMYAQTIVYGLFSARCMQSDDTIFDAQSAIDYIPRTNPLLKSLLNECCLPGGSMHFDELEVLDLIETLNSTDIKSILVDFNRQTGLGKEDPIIYFYELFLDIYEKEEKKRCGVYYTPMPVVDFMVNAVSCLLKSEFDCSKGFLDNGVSVLDPATGTGTFLRKIIFDIHNEFISDTASNDKPSWSEYVHSFLLGRIFGFEFKMAPYAVAHMKLAISLQETGYDFSSNQRLQVYLANSLDLNDEIVPDIESNDPLKKEVSFAVLAKNSEINVIIGNPPYRTDSINKGEWIMRLMDEYKKEPGTNDRLQERNPKVINDDYVKFIRFAQELLKNRDNAIVAYTIPHSIADNLTFRAVRWNLLTNFDSIYILDLHGNIMSREITSAVERDENIFDILQGVCICILVKKHPRNKGSAKVYYSDICGSRMSKFQQLLQTPFNSIEWKTINPVSPYFFFKPKEFAHLSTYDNGVKLTELFPQYLVGIKTHDDDALVSDVPFNTEYNQLYEYRPFDLKYINYDLSKVKRNRFKIMKHFIGHQNIGLVINRQVVTDNWSHVQIVKSMIDNRLHYSRKGIPVLCPMFIYDEHGNASANVNTGLVMKFEKTTDLTFYPLLTEDHTCFDVLDLFDYCYASLFSSAYRTKYKTELSIDFPRVPAPVSKEQFLSFVQLGKDLRELHLFEVPVENKLNIQFIGTGENIVSTPRFLNNRAYINRTQYFNNVRDDIWDFCYGGYHGLQKWLKDRRQMKLFAYDIDHVIRVFNIFDKTENIMAEIDSMFDIYGLL